MIKKSVSIIMCIAFVMLISPTALALDTQITIQAGEPFHNLIVRILNPNTESELRSVYPQTDVNGEAVVEYSTSMSELSFYIIVKHPLEKNVVAEEQFNNVAVTPTMFITFPGAEQSGGDAETEEIEEETTEETTQEEENTEDQTENETSPNITGNAVEGGTANATGEAIVEFQGSVPLAVYFAVAAALLIVIALIIIIFKIKKSMRKITGEDKSKKANLDEKLKDAQQKIKEAQEEIREIKGKRSVEIDKAEEEFKKAKEKLDKLKGGSETKKDD